MSIQHFTPESSRSLDFETIGRFHHIRVRWENTVTGATGEKTIFALDDKWAVLWMRDELRHRDCRAFRARVYIVTVVPAVAPDQSQEA